MPPSIWDLSCFFYIFYGSFYIFNGSFSFPLFILLWLLFFSYFYFVMALFLSFFYFVMPLFSFPFWRDSYNYSVSISGMFFESIKDFFFIYMTSLICYCCDSYCYNVNVFEMGIDSSQDNEVAWLQDFSTNQLNSVVDSLDSLSKSWRLDRIWSITWFMPRRIIVILLVMGGHNKYWGGEGTSYESW